MAKGDPAQTQQVNKVELPAWVNDASKNNYDLATNIASRPLEQYSGPMVAGPSDMTTEGYGMIKSILGQNNPIYSKAEGLLDKAGAAPDAAAPLYGKAEGSFDKAGGTYDAAKGILSGTAGDLDVTKFLNPYTQEVEDRSVANANTSLDKQLLAVANKAKTSGAFGGSRGAVEEAVTRGEGVRTIGDLTAQLRKAGLDYSTNTAIADRSGKQAAAAGLINAASGEAGVGSGYINTASGILSSGAAAANAGQGLLNVASNRSADSQKDVTNLLAAGASDTSSRQAQIDALMKQFYEKRDYPIEGLNTRLAALGMSPYGKTETTNKTSTAEDKGPDWATIGLGAFKTLPALVAMSDRKTKTDIELVEDGEIPIYAYRYKSDPKTYPKVVGPMAQDVQKKYPSAVKKIGGKLTIDIGNLMEALA